MIFQPETIALYSINLGETKENKKYCPEEISFSLFQTEYMEFSADRMALKNLLQG